MGGPLLAAGTLVLAFAFLLSVIPADRFQAAMAVVLVLTNVLTLALFLLRARWYPDERKGWWIFASSIPFVLASSAILALAGPLQSVPGPADWGYLALSLLIGVIQAMALLAWPWRRSNSSLIDLLGSLLFGTSFFLLMWVIGIWQAGFQGHAVVHARTLALAGRLAITSGAAVYLFVQDPRRIRGPLGWVLAGMVMLSLIVGLFRSLVQSGGVMTRISPWFALVLLGSLFLAMAAWSPRPVEVTPDQAPLRSPLTEAVPYLPFLIAGGVLGMALLRTRAVLVWPLLTFLAITGLLVLRQFILLREVKMANNRLEERVAQRTQALEKAQAVLLRTERMNTLATLGAGLAHDLNNLLGVIRNSAELMEMELEEGQTPGPQDLTRILEASSKAGSLTQRLMAFVRQEPGLQAVTRSDLSEALASMQAFLRLLLPRNIELSLDLDPSTCPTEVDTAVLEQILVNLVSNAKDAMPDGGRVSLRLRPSTSPAGHPTTLLEVHDTGPGIPVELQSVIFDAFFTTKPEGKGTGLGLASVRTLMVALGGSVDVESLPGQGTTFRLGFPKNAVQPPLTGGIKATSSPSARVDSRDAKA
jgi:signal transduction histidine kinase